MLAAADIISKARNAAGIRFTEIMEGYVHIGTDIEDFTVAEHIARGSASLGRLYLSVDAFDVDTLIKRADHASLATGTFSCAALSKDPLLILRGEVQFFIDDERISDGENLAYRLTLLSTDNQKYLLNGYKKLDSSMTFSVSKTWKATTTLYTTITRLDGATVGRGILNISWRNFKSELESFGPTSTMKIDAASDLKKFRGIPKFLNFFASKAANLFFSPFRKLSYPDSTRDGYYDKQPPSSIITLTADDGVQTVMKVWSAQAGSNSSGEDKMPILLIPGASVDDQIFSLPTIPVNTVEYFTSRGHVCYVPTIRFGMSPYANRGYTAYDARQDVVAAMRYVREEHNGRKFYVICHCVGAIATSMALLDGSLPSEWIQGMTVSQAFFKLQFGTVNSLKLIAGPKFLPRLYQVSFSTILFPLSRDRISLTHYSAPSWLMVPNKQYSGFIVYSKPHRPTLASVPRRPPRRNMRLSCLPPRLLSLWPSLDPRKAQPRYALPPRKLFRRSTHALSFAFDNDGPRAQRMR